MEIDDGVNFQDAQDHNLNMSGNGYKCKNCADKKSIPFLIT